ncbi:hypothetical protein C8J56DRAFT_1046298 [Mycena floridula]|nr:hypothetical protein C8J56DRAFT_1046298 [Mycena floridula]
MSSCPHIAKARVALPRLLSGDPDAEEGSGVAYMGLEVERGKEHNCAVSHLPIRPPRWAALPTDAALYPYPPPILAAPELIVLDQQSACPYHDEKVFWDGSGEIVESLCLVYTLVGALKATVQLVRCPVRPGQRRRYIGPDPRNLGLFNFNNHIFFSHDLLDDYTNAMTASETPFFAWVTSMERRYFGCPIPFPYYKMVVSAWFAFASLQEYESDMKCPTCSDEPESLLCDGVSISFQKKQLLESLEPPTVLTPDCEVRALVKPCPKTQLILEEKVRKLMRVMLKGPGVVDSTGKEHRTKCSLLLESFTNINESLSGLFRRRFVDMEFSAPRDEVEKVYDIFFSQVCTDESVLQLIPHTALVGLTAFNSDPTKTRASELIMIPSLFAVLALERKESQYSDVILGVARWMEKEARRVLNKLMVHQGPPKYRAVARDHSSWRKTGACYSLPQIRDRPSYPKLPWDQKQKKSEARGDKCSKFYGSYCGRTLSGGLMIMWCKHSICYGFHCIREAEGRDNVFSAIITHWPKAPRHIIYDFACALGPYCMLREPDFFADTQFMVDAFHAQGHTKCSSASMVQNYSKVDPRLDGVNSSAAECGNGVLGQIRKSVSYMGQQRAILYTKVILSAVNRVKILKMSLGNLWG